MTATPSSLARMDFFTLCRTAAFQPLGTNSPGWLAGLPEHGAPAGPGAEANLLVGLTGLWQRLAPNMPPLADEERAAFDQVYARILSMTPDSAYSKETLSEALQLAISGELPATAAAALKQGADPTRFHVRSGDEPLGSPAELASAGLAGGSLSPVTDHNLRRAEILLSLLDAGADPAESRPLYHVLDGLSATVWENRPKDRDVLARLALQFIERGADVNAPGGSGFLTPTHQIVGLPDQPLQGRLLKACLDAGADLSVRDIDGNTPLAFAVANLNLDTVKQLHSTGADLASDRDGAGNTLLHVATSAVSGEKDQSFPLIRYLALKGGLDLNQPNRVGRTALHVAARNPLCSAACLAAMVEMGADVTRADLDGAAPANFATDDLKRLAVTAPDRQLEALREVIRRSGPEVLTPAKPPGISRGVEVGGR